MFLHIVFLKKQCIFEILGLTQCVFNKNQSMIVYCIIEIFCLIQCHVVRSAAFRFFFTNFLFLEFSVYQLPKVQYVFLAVLIISQYVLFREKDFRRKIEGDVNEILKKELGRIPSRKEVYARTGQVIYYRGFTIVVAALSIFALMVYYNEY